MWLRFQKPLSGLLLVTGSAKVMPGINSPIWKILIFLLLFIWLHWILAAACGIFSCNMKDLVPWPGVKPASLHWDHGVLAIWFHHGTPNSPVFDLYKNGIKQYVFFCVCLLFFTLLLDSPMLLGIVVVHLFCCFKTTEAFRVKSKIGPRAQRARRKQRKKQIIPHW